MSFEPPKITSEKGDNLRIGIAAACYNLDRVDRLISLVGEELMNSGVLRQSVTVRRVPGSMEIPFALAVMADSRKFDALIGLGIVIAGDTNHHDVIGDTTALSLQRISIDTKTPVVNGILVVNTEQQADDRLGGVVDRGAEFARAAVSLANFTV